MIIEVRLSVPGINVISASELAGEMGPIENYASDVSIRGREGLFPYRYQSDEVDRGGNLSRFRNSRPKAAWMLVADNMCKCNNWWMAKAEVLRKNGVNPRDIRCRVANRLTRQVFQMSAGRQLYVHPAGLDRGYVIDKLLTFHRDHKTSPAIIVRDLKLAAELIPKQSQTDEAMPIQAHVAKGRSSRHKGPQELGTLLVAVLAKFDLGAAKSD